MSKIRNNTLLKGASGMLGKTIVFREVRGTLIMSNRPKKRATLTPHQETMRSRFLDSIRYAKTAMENPALKAAYAAAITQNKFSAFHVAQTDALTPPVIRMLDAANYDGKPGDTLSVIATDDFRVVSVVVALIHADGSYLEHGEARLLPDSKDTWQYAATVSNPMRAGTKVTVTVRDLPGNVVSTAIFLA